MFKALQRRIDIIVKMDSAGVASQSAVINAKIQRLTSSAGSAFKGMGQAASAAFKYITIGLAGVGVTFGFLLKDLVMTGVEFERFRIRLAVLFNSAEKGREKFDWVQKFARQTPYQLDEVVDAFIRLKAVSLGGDKDNLLKDLGDLAAATQKPLEQVVTAIMNIKSGVTGVGVRQLHLLAISNEMLEKQGVVFDKAGQVISDNFELVRAVQRVVRTQNFAGMMEEQAKTMWGIFSNIKDAWLQIQAIVTEKLFPVIKPDLMRIQNYLFSLIDTGKTRAWATSFAKSFKEWYESAKEWGPRVWNSIQSIISDIYKGFKGIAEFVWNHPNWVKTIGMLAFFYKIGQIVREISIMLKAMATLSIFKMFGDLGSKLTGGITSGIAAQLISASPAVGVEIGKSASKVLTEATTNTIKQGRDALGRFVSKAEIAANSKSMNDLVKMMSTGGMVQARNSAGQFIAGKAPLVATAAGTSMVMSPGIISSVLTFLASSAFLTTVAAGLGASAVFFAAYKLAEKLGETTFSKISKTSSDLERVRTEERPTLSRMKKIKELVPLIEEYDLLSGVINKTRIQQDHYNKLTAQIQDIMPNVVLITGRYGETLGVNTQELKKFLEVEKKSIGFAEKRIAAAEADEMKELGNAIKLIDLTKLNELVAKKKELLDLQGKGAPSPPVQDLFAPNVGILTDNMFLKRTADKQIDRLNKQIEERQKAPKFTAEKLLSDYEIDSFEALQNKFDKIVKDQKLTVDIADILKGQMITILRETDKLEVPDKAMNSLYQNFIKLSQFPKLGGNIAELLTEINAEQTGSIAKMVAPKAFTGDQINYVELGLGFNQFNEDAVKALNILNTKQDETFSKERVNAYLSTLEELRGRFPEAVQMSQEKGVFEILPENATMKLEQMGKELKAYREDLESASKTAQSSNIVPKTLAAYGQGETAETLSNLSDFFVKIQGGSIEKATVTELFKELDAAEEKYQYYKETFAKALKDSPGLQAAAAKTRIYDALKNAFPEAWEFDKAGNLTLNFDIVAKNPDKLNREMDKLRRAGESPTNAPEDPEYKEGRQELQTIEKLIREKQDALMLAQTDKEFQGLLKARLQSRERLFDILEQIQKSDQVWAPKQIEEAMGKEISDLWKKFGKNMPIPEFLEKYVDFTGQAARNIKVSVEDINNAFLSTGNALNNIKVPKALDSIFENYGEQIREASKLTGLPEQVIAAVIKVESGGNVNAVSKAGAKGPMQLMPGTFTEMGGKDIFDPLQNIIAGSTYLAKQLKDAGGNLEKALAMYNAGPGGDFSNKETQAYVPAVMANVGDAVSPVNENLKVLRSTVDAIDLAQAKYEDFLTLLEQPVKAKIGGKLGVLESIDVQSEFEELMLKKQTDIYTLHKKNLIQNEKAFGKESVGIRQAHMEELARIQTAGYSQEQQDALIAKEKLLLIEQLNDARITAIKSYQDRASGLEKDFNSQRDEDMAEYVESIDSYNEKLRLLMRQIGDDETIHYTEKFRLIMELQNQYQTKSETSLARHLNITRKITLVGLDYIRRAHNSYLSSELKAKQAYALEGISMIKDYIVKELGLRSAHFAAESAAHAKAATVAAALGQAQLAKDLAAKAKIYSVQSIGYAAGAALVEILGNTYLSKLEKQYDEANQKLEDKVNDSKDNGGDTSRTQAGYSMRSIENLYIQPSVSISGTTVIVGDTGLEIAAQTIGQIAVSAVKDAVETGEIDLGVSSS